MNSLLIAAIIVIIMWVAILGIYLLISRRQKAITEEIAVLEDRLENAEAEQEGTKKP